jgi:transcriptional regulator with XRE-family HTH domain
MNWMNWQQELGRQIRDARKRAGHTQERLAAHLTVSREQLSNYENGKSAPPVNVVAEIAAALNTEFEIRGCKIAKDDLKRTAAAPREQQLCFAYDTEHRFKATSLTIRPSRKSIIIKAVVARTR